MTAALDYSRAAVFVIIRYPVYVSFERR